MIRAIDGVITGTTTSDQSGSWSNRDKQIALYSRKLQDRRLTIGRFSVIYRTFVVAVLSLCKAAFGVF